MTNRDLHDALKAELSIPYEELIIKHPTIADLGTEFVDYTEDGVFTLKYPLKDTQRNGYHLLQGGYISSFLIIITGFLYMWQQMPVRSRL